MDTQWTETGATLGTHLEGDPALTMEGLYDQCARDVLPQDPATNEISFQADARGVLQVCQYRPIQCVDDCVSGVIVDEFGCGSLAAPLAP